jgi:hypothetical protein
MLTRKAVFVQQVRGAGSNLPTRLSADIVTEVAATAGPVLRVATAGGTKTDMHLIFRGGGRSGTLAELRPGPRPDLFVVQTADRSDLYLVQIDPEMARKITEARSQNDPCQAFAAHLARSLKRQQQEARRRLSAAD